MAFPDLIFRQKHLTMSTAMNVKTMLADFLRFVTPKTMHKARFSVLLDAVTALAKDARCWLITSFRSLNNIMPISFFLPAFTSTYFYSF